MLMLHSVYAKLYREAIAYDMDINEWIFRLLRMYWKDSHLK
jgi:hypothetical protein